MMNTPENLSIMHNSSMMPSLTGPNVNLFIFEPMNVPLHMRRSHVYNFGPEFVSDVQEQLHRMIRSGQNVSLASRMMGCETADTAILPNPHGTPLDLSVFNNLWAFLLVIDAVRGHQLPSIHGPDWDDVPCDVRYIYSGYCSDEPINPLSFGNVIPTPNPMAALVITHHTIVSLYQQLGNDPSYRQTTLTADSNIISSNLVQQTSYSSDPNYLMTPEHLITNTSFTEDQTLHVYDGTNTKMTAADKDHTLTSSLNMARGHTTDLVLGVANATLHTVSEQINHGGGMMGDTYSYENINAYNDPNSNTFMSSLPAIFGSQSRIVPRVQQPIAPDQPVMLGELLRKYPNLNLNDCRRNSRHNNWDVMSPEAPHIGNMFSSLISTTIPVLLSQFHLTDISFRYRSRPLVESYLVNPEPECQMFNIAGFVPLSIELSQAKFKLLIDHLRYNIFPSLLLGGGDFDLTMTSSVAGTSLVDLKFLDYPQLNSYKNTYFETNNALGGLISPLIGNNNEYQHNARQLGGLLYALSPNTQMGYAPAMPEIPSYSDTNPNTSQFMYTNSVVSPSMGATSADSSIGNLVNSRNSIF